MSDGKSGYFYSRFGYLEGNSLSLTLRITSEMQRWCEEHGQPEAAEELNRYIEFIGEQTKIIEKRGAELSDLMYAVEWHASSKRGVDGIERALKALKRE